MMKGTNMGMSLTMKRDYLEMILKRAKKNKMKIKLKKKIKKILRMMFLLWLEKQKK
jgi:hypothetical protein